MPQNMQLTPKTVSISLFVFFCLLFIIYILSLKIWKDGSQETTVITETKIETSSPLQEKTQEPNETIAVQTPTIDTETTTQTSSSLSDNIKNELIQREAQDRSYEEEFSGKYKLFQSFFTHSSWWRDMTRQSFSHTWWEENIEIQENESVKVQYPKGSYKPSVIPRWWAGFIYNIGKNYDSITLQYDITLWDNFNFVKGGKLPWICGWDCSRWGEDASEWFSVNFVWRSGWILDTVISSYASISKYWDYTNQKYFTLEAGKTYKLEQYIQLNTPGKNDGIIQIKVNGKEVYKNTQAALRNSDSIHIDSILFSTFFGGWDDSWATPVDTSILFDNFQIHE